MKRVETIVRQMLEDPGAAADEELVNRLLDEFHSGAPLEYLRPLLLSPDPEVARSGAWIASELGPRGKPLLDVVFTLLRHPDKRVRFWVNDCILSWTDSSNGREVAGVISSVDDPEMAVRWKAMLFLSRAETNQLAAALDWFAKEEPESLHVPGLRWLLSDIAQDAAAVEKMLANPVAQMRKYAVVAAAKMAATNRHPLTIAASSEDSDVVDFATERLEFLRATEKR